MLTKIMDDQKTYHDVDEKKVSHTKLYFIVIIYNIKNLSVKTSPLVNRCNPARAV